MQEIATGIIGGLSLLLVAGSLLAWGAIGWKWWNRQPLVPAVPRLPVPWSGTEMLVLALSYLGCQLLAGNLAHWVAGDERAAFLPLALGTASLLQVAWFVVAVVYLLRRGAYLDDLGWDTTHWHADVRRGIWLFFAAALPVLLVQLFFTKGLGFESKHPLMEMTAARPGVATLVLATIAAVGVAPWLEEYLFRVLLQGWLEAEQVRLRKRRDPDASEMPGYTPLVIASALFAAMHASAGPDPAAIFLLSLFLGYAYRQTHRIFTPWVIHIGINSWAMISVWVQYLGGIEIS